MLIKIFSFLFCFFLFTNLSAYPLTTGGERLNAFFDSLDVDKQWQPNHNIDWLSGKALSLFRGPKSTYCSSFVAAAAARLGVPLLAPTDPYRRSSLANSQYDWLKQRGPHYGWAAVHSHLLAQEIANQGCLVIVAFSNPYHPGHVALVRGSTKSIEEINIRGPQIIQAGRENFNSGNLSEGFKHYRINFKNQRMVYYAHSTPFCRIIAHQEKTPPRLAAKSPRHSKIKLNSRLVAR